MRRFLLTLAALCLTAAGYATTIRSVETEVYIHANGNAVVQQSWDVTVTKGTEWYIPINDLMGRDIRRFIVYEGNRRFDDDGYDWDSDRTLEEKTHRCGVIRKRYGVELCWGQGPYGDHKYDLLYVIDNLALAMADGENVAFNWQFLNDEWEAPPERVRLTVHNLADTSAVWVGGEGGNMGVWVCGGEYDYRIEDGTVIVESTEPLRYESSLIVMMRFDRDMFIKNMEEDERTFEQLREDAFSGSDYRLPKEEMPGWKALLILIGILAGIFLGLPFLFLGLPIYLGQLWKKVTGRRYKKAVFGQRRITGWERDVPFDGNLTVAYSLLADGDDLASSSRLFTALVGAYYLRWVQQGLLVPVKDPEHPEHIQLRFTAQSQSYDPADTVEKRLFTMTRSAAGSNLLLEDDEFKRWSKNHYTEVCRWPDRATTEGRVLWHEASFEQRCKVVQFKNFLTDFTLSKVREVPEVGLWKDYLVFAQLFGVADRISESIGRLYPKYFAENHLSDVATTRAILTSVGSTSSLMMRTARAEKSRVELASKPSSSSSVSSSTRYHGGGGHSSFRGGGGHSGGGHGGGSR